MSSEQYKIRTVLKLIIFIRNRNGVLPFVLYALYNLYAGVFSVCLSASEQCYAENMKYPQHRTVQYGRCRSVNDYGTCDDKHFCTEPGYISLCLCQVYPKRFFYFPVEIRQEFFFLYYEASSGIHSPIISVRYLLFSPISIRPLSNTRTLSISRLITSGRYSVKA